MTKRQLQTILRRLRAELSAILGDELDAVILYGSQARGSARSDSDIDVLILVRDDCDYANLIRRTSPTVADISLQNDVVISRVVMTRRRYEQDQTPFLLNMRREGIVVF